MGGAVQASPDLGAKSPARHGQCHLLCSAYLFITEHPQVRRADPGASGSCNTTQVPPGDHPGLALAPDPLPNYRSVRPDPAALGMESPGGPW